jgi:hypothetical protein
MTRPIDTADARRSEIRAGLEDARTAFQDLLMSLAREDLGS